MHSIMKQVQIKRIYEPPEPGDGFRILIDRIWPRGMKKEAAAIDVWMKEVSPSADLRKWFNHEPGKWSAFSKAYKAELRKSTALNELIRDIEKHKKVTLLYSAKNEQYNQAVALQQFINERIK